MCAISGIYSPEGINPLDKNIVKKMNYLQRHRGPNDEGLFFDNFCALGHRRLSIIDLSKDGHQPFSSEDNRYRLVYNGEIYNYIELRNELMVKGWKFRTKTDTEVLLKCFLQYKEKCLHKLNGMFSFVIYDNLQNSLFIARDRMGIKPLYYIILDSKFYFASEMKAFRAIPKLVLTANNQALFDYLCFNRTDIWEETFTNEIKRLPKGHFAVFNNKHFRIIKWWDPKKYADNPINEKEEKIIGKIRELFESSVNLRMRSDVPIGSCLSGGLDSSILVGTIFKNYILPNKLKTFTVSFPRTNLDETRFVEDLNNKYNFTNFKTYPTAEKAFKELKEFVYSNDEPTNYPTFYSQYDVMRLAKENNVTVLLDGQGGDENFAGYHYFHGFYIYGLLKKFKYLNFLKELTNIKIRNQDKSAYETFVFQVLPGYFKKKLLLKTLPFIKKDFFYEYVEKSKIYKEFFSADSLNHSIVQHFNYKLEHLLRMEDRNSMRFSIEARVPYLDYRLVEYLLSIEEGLKIKNGETKFLEKKALGDYTVHSILKRKDKLGFETPVDKWMNSPSWKNLSLKNFDFLKDSFPDIFMKESQVPSKGVEKWKINQLATWEKIWF